MSLASPQLTYVGNVNARALRTKDQIADDLVNNIVDGVRWHDTTTVLKELGCRLFLEMPPGPFCPKMRAASWEAHKRLLDDARRLIG